MRVALARRVTKLSQQQVHVGEYAALWYLIEFSRWRGGVGHGEVEQPSPEPPVGVAAMQEPRVHDGAITTRKRGATIFSAGKKLCRLICILVYSCHVVFRSVQNILG